MRVAFASNDGERVNEHFGHAGAFHVWEIGPHSAACIGQISGLGQEDPGKDSEDRIVAKANALQGCAIACSLEIGGPAAAKLVARHIHPVKTTQVVSIREWVEKLQQALQGNTPPWLAKAMGWPRTRRLSETDAR